MIQNYLKIAWRNVLKSRLLSFISLSGLAVGMAACLLLLHYVTFELSYDKFHDSAERIYRLRYERTDENGEAVRFASCCPPAAPRIRDEYPEVEKIARIFRYRAVVSHDDRKFLEEKIYFAEPDFLDILKFEFISGDPLNGLRESSRAFISRSTALKYFGDQDPTGQILTVNGKTDYRVVGIFEDVPPNSHLKFDFLLSFENIASYYGPEVMEAWGHTGFYTYLRLRPQVDAEIFEKKLLDLVESEFGEVLRHYKLTLELILQPLQDIHLTSHFMQELEMNGDRDAVNFLFIIALFVIIIAWVNYINLSTAASSSRAREIGLRKVVGATRSQLRLQLFLEIFFLNLFSAALALTLVDLSLPFFSQVTGTPPDYNLWGAGWFWTALAVMFLVGVFLPGLYPVVVISSFKPVDALRDKLRYVVNGVALRKCLVVFQFAMAFGLIAGTLVVYKQVTFMKKQELGFNIDQTLVVKAPRVRDEAFNQKVDTFKETLLTQPTIRNVSFVTEVPGRQILWDAGGIHRAGEGVEGGRNYQIVGCDYNFFDLFELDFLRGRQFSREFSTDDKALVLNETAVTWMGFEDVDAAVGQQVDYWGELFTIIGVVKDYHQQSLKAAFEPTLFRLVPYGRGKRGVFAVKLQGQNVPETVAKVDQLYEDFFPGNPFDQFFLDDYFDQQYRTDELLGKVLGIFSLLAIFVTGLGVFGLSFFTVLQRTKEIGIRKVLGADAGSIVFLLTKELLILVAVANLIAWPLSYFIMRRWLDHFANRIELHPDLFVSAALTTFLIALVTIVFQVVKAAAANPVDSLRYE
jgi:putative ABC transport system permease protein